MFHDEKKREKYWEADAALSAVDIFSSINLVFSAFLRRVSKLIEQSCTVFG